MQHDTYMTDREFCALFQMTKRSASIAANRGAFSGAAVTICRRRKWSVGKVAAAVGSTPEAIAEAVAALPPDPEAATPRRRRADATGEAVTIYEPGYF